MLLIPLPLSVQTSYKYRPLGNFFQFFEDLSQEHESTFDPDHMRDFIDVYCAERKRVASEELKNSSFYGESGRLNYVNTMFDLFLVIGTAPAF